MGFTSLIFCIIKLSLSAFTKVSPSTLGVISAKALITAQKAKTTTAAFTKPKTAIFGYYLTSFDKGNR